MNNKIEEDKSNFRKLRYNYLSYMINQYQNENNDVEERIRVLLSLKHRQCSNDQCSKVYNNYKRKCDDCDSAIKKQETPESVRTPQTSSSTQKYINIGEKSESNIKDFKMGEPILVNPNSYINIEQILKELKTNLNIGSEREWTFVGADGPPYCLASRIIEREPETYDWVSMVPGLGKNYYRIYF